MANQTYIINIDWPNGDTNTTEYDSPIDAETKIIVADNRPCVPSPA